jgi:hypothetical protein
LRRRVRWTSFSAPGSALLRAQIAFVFRRGRDAPPLLVDAARRLEALDPALARETYLEALGAAMYAGRLSADSGVLEAAEAARAAPAAPQPPRSIDLLLDGLARRRTGAWRGVEADAIELINAGLENPTSQGEGRVVAMAGYATAVLNNGLGRDEAAVEGAMRGSDDGDWGYAGASLPEIVEAATRSGRPRSLPPRCPGWRSAHAPRAQTGLSGSWHARGRC